MSDESFPGENSNNNSNGNSNDAQGDEHPRLRPGSGRLRGKTAVVTGANSGIGRATARLFAREGAKVLCCDIQETVVPRVDQLIRAEGGEAFYQHIDVTRQEDCDLILPTALEQFGGLDILFNNAGGAVRKKLHEYSDEEWRFVVDLNLNAMFRIVRAVIPHFMKQGSGNIVSNSSTYAAMASPEYPAYCATKAAIMNLTRSLALDYGPFGIRANCVCPGSIDTPRIRGYPPRPLLAGNGPAQDKMRARAAGSTKALLRMGSAEEVAYAVLFLASEESSFITGHGLVIDGGQTISV
ncbi:MAG TPA: SDR family NAD(P)-dependent oxidoreductase [Herbaspirillum sp.]|jgi:NAD(P)-dependent dehydrogenase (short-subunit alcohol dehydrogenase family)